VKREYEMEIKAGIQVVSHKASHPPSGKVGPADLLILHSPPESPKARPGSPD
jgi:hypothetical protein